MGDVQPLVIPVPSPVLDPTDPVVLAICRYAGAVVGTGGELENCNGLTLADVLAAAYENREELYELPALRQGLVLKSDRDGWPENTIVSRGITEVLTPDDTSQAWVGTWVMDNADVHGDEDVLYLSGYSYDMHGAAATFLDAWAARLKLLFNFNDGSGNYNVESKYRNVTDMARTQRAQARPHDVLMYRSDTGDGDTSGFESQGGW